MKRHHFIIWTGGRFQPSKECQRMVDALPFLPASRAGGLFSLATNPSRSSMTAGASPRKADPCFDANRTATPGHSLLK